MAVWTSSSDRAMTNAPSRFFSMTWTSSRCRESRSAFEMIPMRASIAAWAMLATQSAFTSRASSVGSSPTVNASIRALRL